MAVKMKIEDDALWNTLDDVHGFLKPLYFAFNVSEAITSTVSKELSS